MKPIFVLNLGSTSTKVAIFKDKSSIESTTLRHSADALSKYPHVLDQIEFRKEAIETWLKTVNHSFDDFELLCIRGALLKPIASGIYQINQEMVEELKVSRLNVHVSAVGIILGDLWAKTFNKQAIFLNAPSTDELAPLARYTGIKGINRRSGFHALNQKQIALEYAQSISKPYRDLNLIVCHMGGGISVGVHHQASVIDVNHALEGEGPMSPERSGALSVRNAIELFKHVNYDETQFYKLIAGNGGLVSHTGISDVKTLFEQSTSDLKINEVLDAMIYQIAKEIGAMSTVVEGKVDAILLTGGLAYSTTLIDRLKARVDWIAPVFVYPGEDEMYALAMGAYRYLEGQETLKEY